MSKSVKQCKKISRIYIKKEANIKKYQGYIKKEVNIKKINNISWRGQIYNMNNMYIFKVIFKRRQISLPSNTIFLTLPWNESTLCLVRIAFHVIRVKRFTSIMQIVMHPYLDHYLINTCEAPLLLISQHLLTEELWSGKISFSSV